MYSRSFLVLQKTSLAKFDVYFFKHFTGTREIWMNMINTKYNSTEDMIIRLQSLKCKTKIKIL